MLGVAGFRLLNNNSFEWHTTNYKVGIVISTLKVEKLRHGEAK